jgi:hypothetical protein
MRKTIDTMAAIDILSDAVVLAAKSGQIVEISPAGKLVVDYDGNTYGPIEARCVKRDPFSTEYGAGCRVLLIFEDQDPLRPIVIGVLSDTYRPETCTAVFRADDSPSSAIVDGNRVRLRARQEIVLECGQSSLLLRSDGKIILKGVEIVSRASKANKVRGACVKIN